MKVVVPSALHSYTKQRSHVEASGATLDALLQEMDRRYPGLRFRIIDEQDRGREHIKIFINGRQVTDLASRLAEGDEIRIVTALSGG